MSQSVFSENSGTRFSESQSQEDESTTKLASQQEMSSSFLTNKTTTPTTIGASFSVQNAEESSQDVNDGAAAETNFAVNGGLEDSRFSMTNQSLSSTLFGEVMLRSVQKTNNSSADSRLASLSGCKRSRFDQSLLEAANVTDRAHDHDDNDRSNTEGSMAPPPPMGTPQQQKAKRHRTMACEQSYGSMPEEDAGDTMTFTPSNKAPRAASKLFSPSGFQMMDFINQADSPFQNDLSVKAGPAGDDARVAQEGPPAKKEARPQQFTLSLKPGKRTRDSFSVPFLDWTLKDQVLIELQGMTQPFVLMSKLTQVDLRHQQNAEESFCRQSRLSFDNKDQSYEEGLIRSLMYWQYPPADQYANQRNKRMFATRNTNSQILLRNSSTAGNSLSFMGKDDASRVGGGATAYVRSRQAGEKLLAWRDEAKAIGSERREWQDAFWSLYGKWRLAVQKLQQDETASIEDASRVVFYACGLGHSLIFRVSVEDSSARENRGKKQDASTAWEEESSSSEGEDDQNCPGRDYRAEILISSSNSEMRNKLRQMGAKLVFSEGINGLSTEFDDEDTFWGMLEQSGRNSDIPEAARTTSPSIVAELVALRREQAMGKTVGADISVKTKVKGKNRKTRISPRRLPPLVVSGVEHCACFAEWYLNSCGGLSQESNSLPVLVSRSVGPFLHASLKQSRFQRAARFQDKPALLLKGFVLPCALRDMVQHIIELVLSNPPSAKKEHDKETVSIRFRTHSGYEAVPAEGGVGGPSTTLFNGGSFARSIHKSSGLCCEYGETAAECSFNPIQPDSLTMKVETQTTI